MLAAEIYERITQKGIRCNLDTGREWKHVRHATHGAATIEMAHNAAKANFNVTPAPTCDDDDDKVYCGGTNSIHSEQDSDR